MAFLLSLLLMSMRLDEVECRLASFIAVEMTEKLGIPLDVEAVEVRSINDVCLKNVTLYDLCGDTLLHTREARAYVQTKRLLAGEVRVNTLVFAAPDIRLNRPTPNDALNVQFLIDIINGNKKNEESKIDLRINQLLVYDGSFAYDVLSAAHRDSKFDPNHIAVSDIACNVSLKRLVGDELDLYIRSVSGREKCGFTISRLRTHLLKEGNKYSFSAFELRTPSSNIVSENVEFYADSVVSNISLIGNIRSDSFTPDDILPFVNLPRREITPFAFNVDGFFSKENVNIEVSALAHDNSFGAKANVSVAEPFAEHRSGQFIIDECYANEKVINELVALAKLDALNYDIAGNLGKTLLKGDVSFDKDGVRGDAFVDFKNGFLFADGFLDSVGEYSLSVNGMDLKMGVLAGVRGLGGCDINIAASGNMRNAENYANVSGDIANLVYNGYRYEPIGFNGKYTANTITAKLATYDPNAKIQLSAKYSAKDEKMLKLSLHSDKLTPENLNLFELDKKMDLIFDLNGEFIDYGAGKTIINAKVDNLSFIDDADTTFVRNFYVCDNKAGDDRLFVVTSDFATASIYGDFDFRSVLNRLNATLKSHLPVLDITPDDTFLSQENNFCYDVSITDSSPLTKVFGLPVTVLEPSRIKGTFNESESLFTADASINKIDLNGGLIRSLSVDLKSGNRGIDLNMQFNKPLGKKNKNFRYDNLDNDIVVRLNANVASNEIKGLINWNNFKADETVMGMVRMDAALSRNIENKLELSAKIHQDSIIRKNSVWYINESTISGEIDKLFVKNLGLSSDRQDLKIEGVIGKEQSDSLNAYLKNVDVATVFDMINFRILDFGGKATGTAHLTGLLSAPNVGGRLDVSDFSIDGAVLGRGDVFVGWEDKSKSILLDAGVYNSQNEKSTVKGFLSQAQDTITLMIDATNINAAFLNKKLYAFLSDIDGSGSGRVHIHGGWRAVDFEGAVAMNCSAKVNANNTRYYFTGDSIKFSKGKMSFDNARLLDRFGNKGTLSGVLGHKNLTAWTCNFNVKANEMLVYETFDFGSLPFYGTVYATGDALIKSDNGGFLLKANMKSTPGSRFVYNSNDASGAQDNSFVTFTDSSKRKKTELQKNKDSAPSSQYNSTASKLTLDFMLDVNDALELRVYTNVQTDDYITLYGNGPINAIYDDKTGFSMKGHLGLTRGSYRFTIQNIFPKVFEIASGSTLEFNGDPYKAELDIKAKYLVPSASLSDLTTEIAKRRTVKVNCVMNITGKLESPDLAFDLELPEGSEEERELLASVASTPDQKNMQFVYLLGVGKFYTFDTNLAQTGDPNSSTAVESLISNTISGQLNNMLGKIINNGNWDISGNISTSERGWNSMEVEGMLRGRLLNNRLQINGNLGYRENPIANRNFIGDFELLWLLSPKYNWNIKAYSKTNDRYFSKTDLTTQGIGTSILFEFDSWKWWGKKKRLKKELSDVKEDVAAESEQAENVSIE